MGLKITNEINTTQGSTTELYINVRSANFAKAQYIGIGDPADIFKVEINTYLNEAARVADPTDTCMTTELKNIYDWISGGSPDELDGLKGNLNAFEFAYSKVKESLELAGFTVVDVD